MKSAVFVFLSCLVLASTAWGQTVTIGTSAAATNPQRSGEAGTGTFTPASGAVAISSTGTEEIRVTGSGVGIGTTNPGATYSTSVGTISPTQTLAITQVPSGYWADPGLLIASNLQVSIDLVATGTGGHAWVLESNSGTSGEGQGSFAIKDLTNSGVNPFLISSSGNTAIGSGVTTPASLLTVNGAVSIGTSYVSNAAPTNGAIIQGSLGIGTTNPGTTYSTSVGTISPTQTLAISQAASSYWANPGLLIAADLQSVIDLIATGTGGHAWVLESNSGSSGEGQGTFAIKDLANSGAYPFLITGSGNTAIGSGVTSPASILTVNGAVSIGTSYVSTAAPTNGAIIQGNVGIGTTTPASSLDLSAKTDAMALPVGTTGQRPTGVNGMMRYNSTTSQLEGYVGGSWVPVTAGSAPVSSAGQLQCGGANCITTTGSGTLNYCPYKGNVKTTASQGNYTIPSACLSATLTSMYVGGTASTSVAASTLYYIYLWNTSGTWVLDAETTGHATDSSTGIEIKSGDNTKTLVGMIHTDTNKKIMTGGKSAAGQFDDVNTVATWDNRQNTVTSCAYTGSRSISSTSYVEINSENRCQFMSWGDAAVVTSGLAGYSSGAAMQTQLFMDNLSGLTASLGVAVPCSGASCQVAVLTPGMGYPTEGYRYTIIKGETATGVTNTYLAAGIPPTTVYTVQ